jgi:methylphosphotriester-DNA--protein-cysteine methyltransferase
VRIRRPAPELAALIDSYYFVETNQAVTDLVLASPGNIRFAPRGTWVQTVNGVVVPTGERAALFGPTSRTAVFGPTGPGLMIGAGLTPLGWAQLLDVPASVLSDKVVELGDVIGTGEADIVADAVSDARDDQGVSSILDDWLVARAAARPAADPRIAKIHRTLLNIPDDVPAFADAAGVSERTLHRLCGQAFGFAPKRLLRLKRFQRTLERVRGILDQPLSGLIDDDYFDQAHFNREFRRFMGMTPSAYFNSPREIMRRALESRRAVTGNGIQGLHPIP